MIIPTALIHSPDKLSTHTIHDIIRSIRDHPSILWEGHKKGEPVRLQKHFDLGRVQVVEGTQSALDDIRSHFEDSWGIPRQAIQAARFVKPRKGSLGFVDSIRDRLGFLLPHVPIIDDSPVWTGVFGGSSRYAPLDTRSQKLFREQE